MYSLFGAYGTLLRPPPLPPPEAEASAAASCAKRRHGESGALEPHGSDTAARRA